MRLSKIKLSGFKSFVDPTTVHFPSNLMGVVGPNGCGKSNIIDAIRWVLGETSAKTLRGDSMADVIFNGSSGRKPVGQASIELTFDNSDGTVTGAYASYSEIAVRRVVSREGISQYYLNSARCRRKDITQILLGTGLGAHGYSIIEQGMISRLVEAKPEELRAFLEEAAGISKYKERRRETENRIRHTRENLERLADLRDEIEKQLTHLQRQARAAERYTELKSKERQISAELLVLKLRAYSDEISRHEKELGSKTTELEATVAEQRNLDSQIEKLRVSHAENTEEFSKVQGSYYRAGAEIARLEQAIQHRKETIQRQEEDLATTLQQLGEIANHIESDETAIEQLELTLKELNPDLSQARSAQQEAEDELQRAEQTLEAWRSQWNGVVQQIAEAQSTVQVESSRIEQVAEQLERNARDESKAQEEREELDAPALEKKLTALVANEEQLRTVCIDGTRSVETATGQLKQLREQEEKIITRLDEVRKQLQDERGRLSSLEALQEAALGKSAEQVDGWLSARGLADGRRLAETLNVAPGWERAVESALGAYLQAVNVRSIDELASDVSEIAQAGFALVESTDDSPGAGYDGHADGGWLADRVMEPSGARHLLRGIRTADSLASALEVRARLGDGESVITRDGFWLGRHWLRVSGNDDPRVGVIARNEEIDQLRKSMMETSRRVDEMSKALTDTRTRIEQLDGSLANAQKELNRRQQMYAEVRSRLTARRNELNKVQGRANALSGIIEELTEERERLRESEVQSKQRLEKANTDLTKLESEHKELESRRSGFAQFLTSARENAEKARADAQAIAIKVESRRSSRESAAAALQRVQSQREHLQTRKEHLEKQAESSRAPLAEEEAKLVSQRDEHKSIETQLAEARKQLETVETGLRESQEARTLQQEAVQTARETVDSKRMEVREVQVRADTVREQFAATELDFDEVSANLPDESTKDEWAESLERVGRSIQRLGAINLAAIDEYKEQSERKQYLDSQYEDLSDALETLENAIRKIDRETRSRFKETFDKANQGLSELFPRLFGGGQGYLEMDGTDLLNSGVTIMARPPGKRISTIHLLSGGEKALTAVALVFSIFELNPAPFCLLDEVDAPLDDANVGRFSEIVKEMSRQVQFILITHNKTTMEAMNHLTGVTMNEPGVSRLVAVDIDEAVQLAAM